jgi:hypothetical protein
MLYRLLPLCVLGLLLTGSPAYAHRLYLKYQVLPGNKVQISSFYGVDDFAADGIVAVYRANGELLGERGVLNEKGIYIFSYQLAEDLKVVVTHEGHSKTATIAAKELSDRAPAATISPDVSAEQALPFPVWEIVAGLSFVLAVTAFYLSVRTAWRVRELQRHYLPPLFLTQAPPNGPGQNTAITAAPPATGTLLPKELPTGPAPG